MQAGKKRIDAKLCAWESGMYFSQTVLTQERKDH